MTDQPQGPTEPVPTEPTAPPASGTEGAAPAPETAAPPTSEAAAAQPPPAAASTPEAAPPQPPPAAPPAAPPAGPYSAPYGGYGTYGAPGTPGAPGAPAPGAPGYYPTPVAAQPGYPPQANPYGGYAQAPVYAGGGGPAYPGSLAYVEQNYGKVADFGQRALAYLIDVAITLIGLVPMVIGIIMVAVGASSGLTTDQYGNVTSTGDVDTGLTVVGILLIVFGALVSLGITIWNRIFKMGRTGQSVGKKVIGLYLLDDKTGRPIGAGMCFLRELVQSLVNQVFYIGWLWMLWDADKQTLGDKTVHSSVVVVPKG
jgi:uncharacterized RDD family membrane protein YckC